jgi:hypothetical protein
VDEQLEYGFGTAVYVLDHTAEKLSVEEADSGFGEVTKENFWRMWPDIRAWAEDLWQRLDQERGNQARPAEDDLVEDVGGGG